MGTKVIGCGAWACDELTRLTQPQSGPPVPAWPVPSLTRGGPGRAQYSRSIRAVQLYRR